MLCNPYYCQQHCSVLLFKLHSITLELSSGLADAVNLAIIYGTAHGLCCLARCDIARCLVLCVVVNLFQKKRHDFDALLKVKDCTFIIN